MFIPIIDLADIAESDIDALMRIGFCYVRLPDSHLVATIQTCMQVAREFFQRPSAEKANWQLKEILSPGDRYEGYALRSQSKNTNAIEQIFFEPDAPFGPYEAYASQIEVINDTFMNAIALTLLQAIFKRLAISQADFVEVTGNPYRSLVFQSCPAIGGNKQAIRLNAHKDFGLLTVLFFNESGLEVHYENEWKAITPEQGCVVVNLGNATELMTGGRCHSALHRVTNATDNRMSTVYFINPNYRQQVKNYIDNTLVAATGELFFKQQFTDYYQLDH